MKKFATRFLMLAALAIGPAFADNVLYIDPVFQVANSGATVSIDVLIDAATDISGVSFDLMYNPTFASLSGFTFGSLPWDDASAGVDDTVGTISGIYGVLFGPGGISTTNGLLMSYQFLMSGPGLANFSIGNVIILDEQGNPIVTGEPLGGSVQVNGPSAIPEPSTYLLSASALLGLLALRRRN